MECGLKIVFSRKGKGSLFVFHYNYQLSSDNDNVFMFPICGPTDIWCKSCLHVTNIKSSITLYVNNPSKITKKSS